MMETYKEMNSHIVELLRITKNPTDTYAADRIEQLEALNTELLETLTALYQACVLADNHEELSEYVDGFLLDNARAAIAQATENR